MLWSTKKKGDFDMRSSAPILAAKAAYLAISAVISLIGLAMLLFPGVSAELTGTVIGIAMIVFGLIKLAGYFSRDLFRLAFQFDLAFGLLLIAIGVIVVINPIDALSFICVALGIPILADGLFKIQIAVDSRRFGIRNWWVILIVALITGFFGLTLVFRPAESAAVLMLMLGAALITEGALNMLTVLSAVKIIKHQQPDDYVVIDET